LLELPVAEMVNRRTQEHAFPTAKRNAPAFELAERPPQYTEPVPIASDGERTLPDARGPSPGASKGNRNAFKHGRYTAKAIEDRRNVATLLRVMRELAREV
jgi:hypothetical protein